MARRHTKLFFSLLAAITALRVSSDIIVPAPTDESNDVSHNVTVNDSPDARKDITTAHDLESQKEWNKAAGWYQTVLEKYRTRVVPVHSGEAKGDEHYRGIVYDVQQSLAQWPAEGVTAYRARYEATARKMLDLDDAGALHRVLQNYFLTDSAKVAGLRLIDLHMEAGEFDAAAGVGDVLLDSYPKAQLTAERPRLLFRTALAHHFAGDAKAAAARADELDHNFADAQGKVFGKDVVLSKSLAGLLKAPLPANSQGDLAEAWTMFGGSPDRARVSTAAAHVGARIASIELPPRNIINPVQQQAMDRRRGLVQPEAVQQSDEDTGMTLGIMPVVDHGELFFQDGARVWARSLDSGFPLLGWATSYGNSQDIFNGVFQLRTAGIASANAGGPRGVQYTLTLTHNSVFGIMGRSLRTTPGYRDPNREMPANFNSDTNTRLVCLDRKTGQERWHISPGTLAGDNLTPDDHEHLRALDFSGSPLVVGDSIYLIGRGGKDVQFENCYVIAVDSSNGHYRWSCLIAISNTPANGVVPGEFAVTPATASHLAYAGGRVYINTNLGALAAIDASTGSVAWLSLYRPDIAALQRARQWNQQQNPGASSEQTRPWEFNPVIARDGKLFSLPIDSKYLFVYDSASGAELKAIDLTEFQPEGSATEEPRALLAVVGDDVILSGSDHVFMVKWAKYDTTKSFADNVPQAVIYTSTLSSNTQKSIRGRAFVTADSVLVTTDKAMSKLNIRKGLKAVGSYPENGQDWGEVEGPGNVIASGEHLVIAGSKRVNIYTDMSLARARLDKAVAAAPNEVDPRLDYAEVMFGAGDTSVALEKLNEAAQMLGGLDQMRSGESRRKIFETALNAAEKLAKDKRGEANEAAIKFYDLAAKAADLPHDQVAYRFSRAQFYHDNRDEHSAEKGIALYQEILLHPDWRSQHFAADEDANNPGVGGSVARAGTIATQEIAAIKAKRPDAYAAQEKLAADAMTAARASNDAGKLLAVAETYPNSDTASRALFEAAALYEKSADARNATRVLRQLYRDYTAAPNRAQSLEALARNYLLLPDGIQIAAARLSRAKDFADTKLSQPLALPDGTKIADVTFKEAAARLDKLVDQKLDAPLVDLHVPDRYAAVKNKNPAAFLAENDPRNVTIADVTAILQPQEAPALHVRGDRLVVAMHDNAAALIAPGNAKPLGICTAFTDIPVHAAWFAPDSKSVIVWSHNEIAALDASNAKPLWVVPVKSFPASNLNGATGLEGVDIVSDTPPAPTVNGGGEVIINGQVRGRGGVFIGRNFRGQVRINNLIQQEPPATPAPTAAREEILHAIPLGDRVILATSTGRVACIKSTDGTTLWQTPISTHVIDRIVANADFTAVKVTEDGAVRLIVLDNSTGEIQTPIRSFAMSTGLTPQNMALSPDGMLVWTTPDRLCGKDLYEPGKTSTFEFPPRSGFGSGPVVGPVPVQINANGLNRRFVAGNPNGPYLYNGCNRESQLLIRGNRIYTVELNGSKVVAHSLETGEPLTHADKNKITTPTQLDTNATGNLAIAPNTGQVLISLSTAGPYLYILGPRTLIAYNMDHPADDHWEAESVLRSNPNYQIAVPTKSELCVFAEPQPRRPAEVDIGVPVLQLRLYDRGQVAPDATKPNQTVESGYGSNVDYILNLHDPHGIRFAVPIEGGIYYLAGDQVLHFLAGARQD